MFNPKKNNRGQILVLVAIALVVIIGFAALAIDIGFFYHAKNQLQGAADAAALAGSQFLPDETAARATAVNQALKNTATGSAVQILNGGDGTNTLSPTNDITVGNWSPGTGYVTPGTPKNAIQVRTRRTADSPGGGVNRFFGKIFRVIGYNISDKQDISAKATAAIPPKSTGFVALHQDACSNSACSYPSFCSLGTGGTGSVLDPASPATNLNFMWTSLTESPTSASGVSGLICSDPPAVDNCNNQVYATNGVVASTFRDLESAMYDPNYERISKDINASGQVTGWWVTVPVLLCPPGVLCPPNGTYQVIKYAKIHIKVICVNGTYGCKGDFKAPGGACGPYPNTVIVIDQMSCIDCSNPYPLPGTPRLIE